MKTLLTPVLVVILALAIGCYSEQREPSTALSTPDDASKTYALRIAEPPVKRIRTLFIHRSESSGRNDVVVWQEVLAPYGIEVFGRVKDELEPTDFSGIDLVLAGTGISDRTQRLGFSTNVGLKANHTLGEEPTIVNMLSESGLPIIEISASKYTLFYELGFPHRSGLGRYKSEDRLVFRVAGDSQEYRREPFPFDGQIALTSPAGVFWYGCPPPSMDGIVVEVDRPGLYPVVRYQQYVSWRLGRDARRLPEEGKRLFANIAYALVRDDRERTDAERMADLRQCNYDNALEYYSLFGNKPVSLRDLEAKVLDDSVSAAERRLCLRARRLWEFRLDWHVETPDATVSEADRNAVNQVIHEKFPDQAARETWEKVTIEFYDGRRCCVDILRYNRGPLNASGRYLYLIKHEAEWKVICEYSWIS